MGDEIKKNQEKTTILNDDQKTIVRSSSDQVKSNTPDLSQADKTEVGIPPLKKENNVTQIQEKAATSETTKDNRIPPPNTTPMENQKNEKQGTGTSKAGVIAGAAGVGLAGVTLGTVYADEIQQKIDDIQNKLWPEENPDSGTEEAATTTPGEDTPVEAVELTDNEIDAAIMEELEAGGVIADEVPAGDVIEGIMIDTDGDGSLDYYNIQEINADGSFIEVTGSDGSGILNFNPLTDTPQGLTYSVTLQDFDSDGAFDDGFVSIVDPEGNNVTLDEEAISGNVWAGNEFASIEDYEQVDSLSTADEDPYGTIDWESFNDEPVELVGIGTETPSYSEVEVVEENYFEQDPYTENLQNMDFDSWEVPESFIESF